MEYRGRVQDGVVVFEDTPPPDGSDVRVEVIATPEEPRSIWEKLRKYSGAVKGLPPDMARNHDHYLRGSRKK